MTKYLIYVGKIPRMVLHVGAVKYPCIPVEDGGSIRQIIQTDDELHYRELLKWPHVEPLQEITPAIRKAVEEFIGRVQKRAALISLEKEMLAAKNRSKEALAAAKAAEEQARRTAIEADNLAKKALDLAKEAEKQAKIYDEKQKALAALTPPTPAPEEQTEPEKPEKPKKNGKRAKKEK